MLVQSKPDSRFERDPRRIHELKMRPVADRIYKELWGDDIEIARVEQGNNFLLDKEFAIDSTVITRCGMILTGQEKFLRYKYSGFRTITVEYMNNPITGEIGDWFKLAPMFYFVGYATNDNLGFYPWVLLNWLSIVLATNDRKINWEERSNQNGRARANFKFTKMDSIPNECIIASKL